MGDFKSQGGEPLHEPSAGRGVVETDAEGCRVRAYDIAAAGSCPQHDTGPAGDSELIPRHSQSHLAAPLSLKVYAQCQPSPAASDQSSSHPG